MNALRGIAPDLDLLAAGETAEDEALRRAADDARARAVGDDVHLRGLIEFSNHCARGCLYCGLRAPNGAVRRYRMPRPAVLRAARTAAALGCGTAVLQSGEDPALNVAELAGTVREIRRETGLAVTLSPGELPERDLAALREAGAERYLLKIETSNAALFRRLRPGCDPETRLACLETARRLGYQVGSGSMVGLPGQTAEDLRRDIETLRGLDLDMASVGPFIPCEGTPLADGANVPSAETRVRATLRMMALLRIACPELMMPATTALATLDPGARREGLRWGANVIMPNMGDPDFKRDYRIYPGKADTDAGPEAAWRRAVGAIESLGRRAGRGPGHSPRRRGEEA